MWGPEEAAEDEPEEKLLLTASLSEIQYGRGTLLIRLSSCLVGHLYSRVKQNNINVQGPVSPTPRNVFGPKKPFLDHLYLKTEKCICLKLLV